LLAVAAVDLVFVGPGDLACSLGIEDPSSAELGEAVESVLVRTGGGSAHWRVRSEPSRRCSLARRWGEPGDPRIGSDVAHEGLRAALAELSSHEPPGRLTVMGTTNNLRGVAALVVKTSRLIELSERQLRTLEAAGARVEEHPSESEDDLIEHGREADALMIVSEPVTERVIGELKRCRVVARFGVGVDTIDVDAATAAGVQVTNVPGASVEEVSDHALALSLACARRLPAFDAAVRAGSWTYLAAGPDIHQVRDQVVGVIGLGRIGHLLARKASLLGMRVLAYDPYLSEERLADASATSVQLPELLGRSDYVSIHVTLGPQTRNLIGAHELALMRPSAYLINVARGEIVDQVALVKALAARRIAGAALDVLEEEPPARDDPLLKLPNVLLTPHAAHYSVKSLEQVRQTAVEDVVRVLAGNPARYPVNRVVDQRTTSRGGD